MVLEYVFFAYCTAVILYVILTFSDIKRSSICLLYTSRVIYDDFGSLTFLPHDYDEILEKKGIKACVFNKFTPWLTIARLNNRDHRKICVIDGNVGFTGGINIADKYINRAKRKDHWLDSGVMIKGKGVWSMSVMFLSMWDFLRKEKSDYHICAPDYNLYSNIKNDGYVQPLSLIHI